MRQKLQVKAVSLPVALRTIEAAIQDAWSDTRAQMVESQFDHEVVHTAFGQFLVHNARNRIRRIEAPGVGSRLVPNRRGSAYHVQVIIENLLLTISAVNDPQSQPRFARFRDSYAHGLQLWFQLHSAR